MSTKALLDRNPNPSEHEIRFQLSGNLCRCTGYDKIVRAVQDSAKALAAQHAQGACAAPTNGSAARAAQPQKR
jgi:carbon-monoxide dehydrogenase small subunit